MLEARLYRFDALGGEPERIEVPEALFGAEVNEDLLHRAVRVFLHNQRQGTASVRMRAEVSGGGRKPWRQKGVGRARHGTIRSPLWRHGGVTFGPSPGPRRLRLPKQMRRGALVSALSARFQEDALWLVDRLGFEKPRTKDGLGVLSKLGCPEKVLVVVASDEYDVPVVKSLSNIPGVSCVGAASLHAYQVLAYDGLVATLAGVDELAGRVKDES
ncbi:MAG: 50S ribosomal protein L4 [Candidatus Bipolaricaulota bacterium]